MINVLFVCHGNICRSTMAESLFTHMVKERGMGDFFQIDSAGTSQEELGHSPHRGTVNKLKEVGIEVVPHRARQMTKKDLERNDYIIGMDSWNIKNMKRIVGEETEKIFRLLSFAKEERDIADPWYTGNFDETYQDIKKGLEAFLEFLQKKQELV